jgi:hypothetical protein
VTGSQQDWIDALGPDQDRSGLRIEGDQTLASTLLDGIRALSDAGVRAA